MSRSFFISHVEIFLGAIYVVRTYRNELSTRSKSKDKNKLTKDRNKLTKHTLKTAKNKYGRISSETYQ